MTGYSIRALGLDDLPLYRTLRLAALRDHPEAFGADYQEEQEADLARMIGTPPSVMLGGFVGNDLVGSAGIAVSPRVKQRHKGQVSAVYVVPAWRGTGLARALIDALIAYARVRGLAVLTLSVTVGNRAATRLYQDAGFSRYGQEPRILCVDGMFYDADLMAMLLDGSTTTVSPNAG
jgi:ribosomal protein S18 acetylase RimI-like enzyme